MGSGYVFGAVVPAAGMSSRMGDFKPLLPLCGGTVISTSVGRVLPYVTTAAVVVGNRGDKVRRELYTHFGERVTVTENPDYASTDMLYSIRLGIAALAKCDAFFLVPADMPLISSTTYARLTASFGESTEILYPTVGGRRGHPPLISSRLIPEILAYRGDGGLREILTKHRITEISVDDTGVLKDLDTPEDYRAVMENPDE